MIRHILLIQFIDDATPQQLEMVKAAFLAIPNKIEGVLDVEWGENNSPEGKNENYTHCVMMTFSDESGRQSYLPHPEHDALKKVFKPILKDIIVFDYAV
ncbi:Dabb family protein [Vibrio sp. OCN044]|uniref:Dabb family protein n=1 Tax=Vibrio tetraodonis subsp. pristinus TaxID=2695891 RepID=A0A6L8M094_9VIBR|nr:Dabb family protein [Vibrio tetraodonis]MYM60430.1 Dabb family protein [Vibrio tetraodonis subsp. pristinus]